MALELAGDEAVGRADIMQHFDDRPVGRHGAAGREGDRQHGHGDNQRQDGDAGGDRGLRHGAHAIDPAAMIVEAGARHLRGQRLAQGRRNPASRRSTSLTTIMRGIGSSSSARPEPSHGSTSCCRFLLGIGAHVGDAGGAARDGGGRAHVGLDVAAGNRADLDGDLAPDVRLPIAGGARPPSSPLPVVSAARKVMMATTAVSERPAIEPRGTIGVGAGCARHAATTPGSSVVPWLRHGLERLNRRHAAVPRAGPDGGRRIRPSARCRGWR